jgi:hypothetical protein
MRRPAHPMRLFFSTLALGLCLIAAAYAQRK